MLTRADYNFVVKYGEVTPDGVAVYDLNSRTFVYANRFLREMLGLEAREHLESGHSVLRFVHPEDLEYADNRYRELLSIGCMTPAEFRILSPDGHTKYVSVEVLWLEESYTFALFVRDTTALREHEEYVVKISAQKDTLLDMLLHQLSGPLLHSHDAISDMKKETGREHEAAERFVNMISETTSQCIGVIQQFLQEEHAESVGVKVRRSRFSVPETAKIVVGLMTELNRDRRIEMVSELSDSYITSDPVKFCQVIHQLLSNAVKFTREDGHIRIHITSEDKQVLITVSDNGTGVPPEMRDTLFVQRVNGHAGLKGEPSGGMGLFLCKQLADLIGGTLAYRNLEEGGSVFLLWLPQEL